MVPGDYIKINSLKHLDCKIRISGFPDTDIFEHFLFINLLAKFQLNRSCRFGNMKYELDNPSHFLAVLSRFRLGEVIFEKKGSVIYFP